MTQLKAEARKKTGWNEWRTENS